MKTIFVSIAAYNDPSLEDTIRSAIYSADNPDRISFGVALQYDHEPDLEEFSGNNLNTISYEPETRPGVVRVRYNISKELYSGEDYYLQIDSHYLFTPGWDTSLIDYYQKISSENDTDKVILLPLEVYGDGVMTSYFDPRLDENDLGPILHPVPVNGKSNIYGDYHEIYFGRVGQIFMPAKFLHEVGLDKYSHTTMEITYFSYRIIMSGYRVFQINEKLMWQNDTEYLKEVWDSTSEDDQETEHRFGSSFAKEHPATWHEMSLAYIYNDYSKYAIKDAVMSPQEYWALQGTEQQFLKAKAIFDVVIHNN
jgi:hypothetical protein